jgi:PAS domain S-box-containing protein
MRIRSHLIILVLGATLPVLAFCAVVTVVFWRQQRLAFEQRFLERVRALSVALDAELDGDISTLKALAQSYDLVSGDLKGFYDQAMRVRAEKPTWATVALVDSSGRQLVNLRVPFGAPLPAIPVDAAAIATVVKSGRPAVSRLTKGAISGQDGTPVLVPVKRDGFVRYILIAVIQRSSWLKFVSRYPIAPDATITLLDQDGIVIARTLNNDQWVGGRPATALYENSRKTPEGAYRGAGLEGQRFYSAHSRSKLSDWTVATEVPQESVEQVLWRLAMTLTAGAGATAILAIALVVVFGRRIARPISALDRSARALEGGENVETEFATGVAEVDEVNVAFRESAARLKARESALRDSEERFRTLANTAPVMIWISGPDKLYTWFNKRWLDFVGRTMEQEIGNGWAENVHPNDLEERLDIYYREFDARLSFTMWYRMRRHDGEYRWVLDNGIPLFGSGGTFAGYVGTCIDVTMHKRVEESLREADRRKDEFLANVSHEIRSPMTSILGYADILLSNLKNYDDIECVRTIKQSGNYLLELINDILELSRIEAGQLSLKKEPVSLPTLLNEVHSIMSVRAQEKALPLMLRYDGAIPQTIESDRTRLRQMIINLVSNAIKFTERGSVQIVARFIADESVLQIEVADTGIGISRAMQEQMFQPFTQADTSATREYGGSGLGLAITKRLAGMMGGTISCTSKENEGSTFCISIPVGPVQAVVTKPMAIEPPATVHVPDLRLNCRILVAEDRSEIRYLLRHFLEDAGGKVIAVADGQAAIEAIQQAEQSGQPMDIVIMDMHMPALDGYETTRRLRAAGFTMPIIALTAAAMTWDRDKCLAAGCDGYLKKPIDYRALIELVDRYTNGSSESVTETERNAHSARASKRAPSKILLVDDSDLAARSTCRLLQMAGHEVHIASTGQSALTIARDFKPDVVLLDIKLPDLDGYEVLRELKMMDGLENTRFIALTGYAVHEIEKDSRGDNFDLVLRKPVDVTYLEGLISSRS